MAGVGDGLFFFDIHVYHTADGSEIPKKNHTILAGCTTNLVYLWDALPFPPLVFKPQSCTKTVFLPAFY